MKKITLFIILLFTLSGCGALKDYYNKNRAKPAPYYYYGSSYYPSTYSYQSYYGNAGYVQAQQQGTQQGQQSATPPAPQADLPMITQPSPQPVQPPVTSPIP